MRSALERRRQRPTLSPKASETAAASPPASALDPFLEVSGISARYGSTVAVEDVSLEVQRGEIVALLGANGAGKSTTLKTLIGLLRCAKGRIVFDGHDVTALPAEKVVARGMALTPEGREVFARLTVYENLRMGAGFAKQSVHDARRAEVVELFPMLHDKRDEFAGLLSGGEQQQLAIGRSLMSDPKLLLLDEPSLGLAPIIVEKVFELIATLRGRGRTVILAEQNVDKALLVADRAYVLSAGRVELHGPAATLRQNPDVEDAYLGLGVRNGA